jgi:hypothetical protein
MPNTNKSNKLKESSMTNANKSMPDAKEEAEFIINYEERDDNYLRCLFSWLVQCFAARPWQYQSNC